jgi:transposase-like protein
MNIREVFWKRRWSDKEGRFAVEAWRKSGLSAAKFAEKHGLDAQRLSRWATRLERREGKAEEAGPLAGFTPVVVKGRDDEARVEVVLTSGVVVRVPRSTEPGWVAEVVNALEGGRC